MKVIAPPVTGTGPILLVEDDEGDAVLVRACLTEAGVDPETVRWSRTVRDATAVLPLDSGCVLLDLGLPDADGMSALLRIVDAAPDTAVVVLTGRHDQGGVDALAVGAQDYLVKDDLTADLLGRSIRYAMERKRAQRTTQQLREARLNSAEKARLERGLLPTPRLRSDAVECSTYYSPGRDHAVLGGDFFDVVEVADGRIRAVIGDVMGHGPDEAALGVHLRVAWRTLVLAGTPEEQILPTLASLLATESEPNRSFVTVCDLTLDVADGQVSMRVAGHPAPLRHAHGNTGYLDVQVGPPLGVLLPPADPAAPAVVDPWPATRTVLEPGGVLVLYTDGLLDAYAPPGDTTSLGVTELVNAVTACAGSGSGAATWIAALVGQAPKTSLDDIAIVAMTTRPVPGR